MKKISVVIPVFNVEAYIERCLYSVCQQTYANLEIILIDDGSSDKSSEVCKKYEAEDKRIRFISKRHEGVAQARNIGISLATGEYIGFVDADDWIELNMYEELIDCCEKYHADITVCQFDIDGQGDGSTLKERSIIKEQLVGNYRMEALVCDKYIQNYFWNKLFRRELFKEVKLEKSYHLLEDLDVMYLLFHNAKVVMYIHNSLYHYRKNRPNSTLSICRTEVHTEKYAIRHKRYLFLKDEYPFLLQKEAILLTDDLWSVYRDIIKASKRTQYMGDIRIIKDIIKDEYKVLNKNKKIPVMQRMFIHLITRNEKTLYFLFEMLYLNKRVYRAFKKLFYLGSR